MKCAKIMVIIVIFVFAMSVSCAADTNNASISEDNSQMLLSLKNEITDDTSENSILAQTNNDETLSAQKNSEILRANEEGNYSDLRNDINNGGNLKKSYYRYQPGDGDTIVINRNGFTVNGNGAVIDMKGSNIQAFEVTGSGVTFKNLTIKNANSDGYGGAIYFSKSGTVENCNFTGNNATRGGAVFFFDQGNVTNCNFTGNNATRGGAVYFAGNGNVTNCNFTGNNATANGGAVYFLNNGNVTNCNFTGNTATTGSAIYFYSTSEQNSVSNSIFLNNRANAKDLQVTKNENITITFAGNDNILNAIYSNGDVSFSNVTYWGANGIVNTNSYTPSRTNKESGQNITVEIYGSDDNLVENVTLVTDDKGQVTYDFIKLRNGEYKYKAYHIEDCYYTYAEYKDTFTLNSDLGDFNRLQKYINGASENSILTLCRDYTFTIGSDENLVNGIVIDKPLTINGNGYAINALQKARIFNVNAGNVVLNNIAFTNATASGNGGAIYFSKSGTVENCNFTGNTVTYNGGAVYFNNQGNVSNCNFTGNNATGDGGAVYFAYSTNPSTVRNCNFTGNNATANGGAIRMFSGTVENCNFTGNNATANGGAIRMGSGTVSICNFTDNQANVGGAVFISGTGDVRNCNFTDNKATGTYSYGGAVYFAGNGNVGNCNFTGNTATRDGGAIWMISGTVSNCNFTGNTATTGSAIFFYRTSAQKSVSNSIFLNNRANAKDLQVIKNENNITIIFTGNNNLLNAIYSNGDVSFSNVTYWGANGIVNTDTHPPSISNNAAGQNITIKGVVNGNIINTTKVTDKNGKIVLDAGDYLIIVSHKGDSYYTEVAERLFTNMTFNVNVTNQTSNNRTVNITAKSNIPQDIVQGKLLFILPNSTQINANYTVNGAWWAVHEFDDAGDYVINASYTGLDGVIINNATISIRYDASVSVNNNTLDLFVDDTFNLNATTNPRNLPVNFTSTNSSVVTVDKNGEVVALSEGNATIIVSVGGDGRYAENSTTVNVTVSKVPTSISIENETINLEVSDEMGTGATLNPTGAGNLTYTLSNDGIVEIEDGEIIALKEGNVTITVSFKGNNKYLAAQNKTINVTVTLKNASVTVNNDTLNLGIGQKFNIKATTTPEGLNVTYGQDDSGVYIVDENGVVTALKIGQGTVYVRIGGDGVYAEKYTLVFVNVTKVSTEIKVTNTTLDLKVNGEAETGATLTPTNAGNLTYTSSNPSVAIVEDDIIKALAEGSAVITASFAGDDKYAAAENKTITVNVSLNDASVSVNNDTLDLLVDDKFNLIATTQPKNLTVNFTSSNTSVVTVDNKGNVVAVSEGNAIITVSVGGDGIYAENSTTVTVTVSKITTEITVNPDSLNLFVGDKTVIVSTLIPTDAGNVTFTSSDESVAIVDNKGNVIAKSKGQAIITASFAGNNKYTAAENKTITVDVNLNDAIVVAKDMELNVSDISTIEYTTTPKGLNVTYVPDDSGVVSVDENGVVTALKEGTASIIVSVGDGKVYAKNTTTVTVTVKKINTPMDVGADDITEGENATIHVSLPSDATGNVTTTVNGKNYSSKVKDGNATIIIPDLEYGNYTIPVSYSGDGKYNPSTDDVDFTVKEDEIVVSAPDLTKYYSGNEHFNVNVAYANGRAIAGKEVKITINGITYSRTTDENGSASLSINLNSKAYDVTTAVDNITVGSLVTILPTIEAEDVESESKNIVFSAIFIDGEGDYLKEGTDVSFNIGGVIYNSQVTGDKGLASVNLVLNHGRYIITSFNSVSNENMSNSIAVDLKDADMILLGDEISVGDNATISVTLPSDATGNVTATINGKTYTNQVNNGKANIIISDLAAGNYTAHVTYSGDNNYNHATGNASISVSKVDALIDIEDSVITVGENATVIVILPSDATGDVRIGNENVPLKEGTASAILTGLPVGITTIPVTYSGDDKYNPIETNADVVVNDVPSPDKKNLTIKATADEITEGEDAVIIVTGLENATGNVSAVVHGHVHSAPIIDGTANITIKGLVENATAFVSYAGDDLYNSAVTSVNITVNKNTVNINAGNLTKYYKDPQKFTVTVTDAKGQLATNKTVEITINGVTYTKITDENGTASLNINLNSGEYPVSVAVDDVVVNSNVFVKATIDSSDVVKVFRNDTQYYATFVDVNGTPAANTIVSFNVNGVIYNRTTDENGTAKLNINLPSGEYILTSTNTVTGEKISNVIKVLSVIESGDLSKYFRNASQFIVRIHTADGGYVGAGEEVKFNINGMIYAKKTNATGHAKININLPQGLYTITTYYKEFSQGNSIEVLPILSAEDLSMKYMDGSQFKAQLVDGQGKPYPKQDVRFNINGVFYNRATDSDGVAKLNIRLLAGQYIITSSYNGCNIANKITISA